MDLSKVFDKEEIKESTKKIYISNLNKIIKDYGVNNKNDFNIDLLNKIKSDKSLKDNTIKNKLNTIYVYLKSEKYDNEIIDAYKNEIKIINNEIDKVQQQKVKSEKEKENWIDKEYINNKLLTLKKSIDINKKLKLYSYDQLKEYMNYIILLIHSLYPMRNDLSDTEILYLKDYKENDINKNYIILSKNTGYILLNNFKTNKKYGSIKYDFKGELLRELIKYNDYLNKYKNINKIDNKFLLINKNGDKLNRNDYTKFFISIFKDDNKNIGTTLMRKVIISQVWDNIEQIEDMAHKSQHSISIALKNYVKK
jgi:hypothetical protein